MSGRIPKVLEALIAVAVAFAIFLGCNAVASKAHQSTLLTQSRIFRSLIKDDETLDFMTIVRDEKKRKVVEKFTTSLTNAYVSFELIPYDQGKTFATIMNSINPDIDIELFEYHGRDLIIFGTAGNATAYQKFVLSLDSSDTFSKVEEHSNFQNLDNIEFSITCYAPLQNGYPEFFKNKENLEE